MGRTRGGDTGADRGVGRRRYLSALAGGTAATLAGCSGLRFGPIDLARDAGTYATAVTEPIETLNPIYNTGNAGGNAIARVIDPGYAFDENDEYVPLLYDLSSEDGREWTFRLRDGLRFGDPYGSVTAHDFVYLISEVHQRDWADSPAAAHWRDVSVAVIDDRSFRATLPQPRLLWPESYEPLVYPIPKGLLEPYVDAADAEGLRTDRTLAELGFAGNLGPYVLDEWRRGEVVRLARNDRYYLGAAAESPDVPVPPGFAGAPHFAAAEIRVLPELAARLDAFDSGALDAAAIPVDRADAYRDADGVTVGRVPQAHAERIAVNMRDNGWSAGPGNPFRHRPFRQALSAAIDVDALVEEAFHGAAAPQFTWQPPFAEFHPLDADLPRFGTGDRYGREYARDLARRAFDRSAHDYGFDGDDMVTPDGDRVSLTLFRRDNAGSRRVAAFVADDLGSNLGIDVAVEGTTRERFAAERYTVGDRPRPERDADGDLTDVPDALVDEVRGKPVAWTRPTAVNPGPRRVTAAAPWDMEIVFRSNTFPRNPLATAAHFDGATAPHNAVGYYPESTVTSLFDRARRATDREALAETLAELFVALASAQPSVTLAFPEATVGYRSGLSGPISRFSNGWNRAAWRYE
ncbi:ABC transporter substrate-binding protein [Halorubrum laminariae]|uniref:ABC transporter substrate-binding protein n=1 Tax=Halorubrum laminariae TaxID=1433523 RepID=A0ABD6BY30_9EURY|nr:ABC transporter substrate-binding protein [Halorubrum laminariae]